MGEQIRALQRPPKEKTRTLFVFTEVHKNPLGEPNNGLIDARVPPPPPCECLAVHRAVDMELLSAAVGMGFGSGGVLEPGHRSSLELQAVLGGRGGDDRPPTAAVGVGGRIVSLGSRLLYEQRDVYMCLSAWFSLYLYVHFLAPLYIPPSVHTLDLFFEMSVWYYALGLSSSVYFMCVCSRSLSFPLSSKWCFAFLFCFGNHYTLVPFGCIFLFLLRSFP